MAEDFEALARSIGTGLRREGMAVDVALDGPSPVGWRYPLRRGHPRPGPARCRRRRHLPATRRRAPETRVLTLTAAGNLEDRLEGSASARTTPAKAVRLRRTGRPDAGPGPPVHPAAPPNLSCGDITLTRRAGWRSAAAAFERAQGVRAPGMHAAAPGLVLRPRSCSNESGTRPPILSLLRSRTVHRLRAKLGDPPVIRPSGKVATGLAAMTSRSGSLLLPRRPLQARLTLFYARHFAAGIVVLLSSPFPGRPPVDDSAPQLSLR